MKRLLIALALLGLFSGTVNAQYGSQWRKLRQEVFLGIGGTNFLGELGGSDCCEGSHFVKDYEILYTRPLVYAGYRYKLSKSFSVKGTGAFGWVFGDDATTDEIHRHARNLSFRSPLAEVGAHIEYHILKEQFGHKYDLRRNRGQQNSPSLYIFTGINGFWFNPKGQYTDGEWYALQPLGTEGQNHVATREPYQRISWSVPIGFGMNFLLDRNWGVGFELGARYTGTDYIDDVSTTYVDPNLFDDPIARFFADRSDDWYGAAVYNQRGNSNYNDAYVFITLNVSYKLRPKGPSVPKF